MIFQDPSPLNPTMKTVSKTGELLRVHEALQAKLERAVEILKRVGKALSPRGGHQQLPAPARAVARRAS